MIRRPRGSSINHHPVGEPPLIRRPTEARTKPDDNEMQVILDIGSRRLWPYIQTFLVERSPQIQAGILADVTALWLTTFTVPDDPAASEQAYMAMFQAYSKLVGQMVKLNNKLRLDLPAQVH